MARKRRRGTRGLGRSPAKGRGKYCVMTRVGRGKSRRASTRCFSNPSQADSHVKRILSSKGPGASSVLVYKRKRSKRS